MARPRVVIVQRVLPKYRVPLFEQLRSILDQRHIELELVYGVPDAAFASRGYSESISWAAEIHNRQLSIGDRSLVWQPCWRAVSNADLVVVEQASKLLLNYLLLLRSRLRTGPRVGLWGHGQNRNVASRSAPGEWIKRRVLSEGDWWFAYTEGVADFLTSSGSDPTRITALQNAVDTEPLRRSVEQARSHSVADRRQALGLGLGPIALSLGSLYPARRPEFLIEAAVRVRTEVPDFELLVVGDGESRSVLDEAADQHAWIHTTGALHGPELATALSVTDIVLNPGVVGLNVLDAFACGLPFVTIAGDGHGPEVDYLVSDTNGLVADELTSPEQFSALVVDLLADKETRTRLAQGGIETASQLTIENMAKNFADGIEQALSSS